MFRLLVTNFHFACVTNSFRFDGECELCEKNFDDEFREPPAYLSLSGRAILTGFQSRL